MALANNSEEQREKKKKTKKEKKKTKKKKKKKKTKKRILPQIPRQGKGEKNQSCCCGQESCSFLRKFQGQSLRFLSGLWENSVRKSGEIGEERRGEERRGEKRRDREKERERGKKRRK